MFKVIVSDLDGTLLGPDSLVDPFTARTFQEVRALGKELVFATGRHYLDASHFQRALGVQAHFITLNGARAHDPSGAQLLAEDLDPAIARALVRREIAGDRLVIVYTEDACLVSRPCPELDGYFRVSGFSSRAHDLASLDGTRITKVVLMGARADLLGLEAGLNERFQGRIYTTFAIETCLEVMAAGVSKARALTAILRRLGATPAECIGFGDGQNDLEMLSMVGHPFVMAGASPGLLAALPGAPLAGRNDDSGVARTLRRLLFMDV